MNDLSEIRRRIRELTGRRPPDRLEILADTTEFMSIMRGMVVRLEGRPYLIEGDMREGRFGIDEQPKFWVKKAIDLVSGAAKVLKLVFYEEFHIRVGLLSVRCYRDPDKEAAVLDRVRGDPRFMQGTTVNDASGNAVRIIDFIRGQSLYTYLLGLDMDHETYFRTVFPGVLRQLVSCVRAIAEIHDHGFVHGDIRNDHIIIDRVTGRFRWIDFDLCQDMSDFDVWSLGNVLLFAVGKGELTFHDVATGRVRAADGGEFSEDDASAFFAHRIMNLKKVYPYIPDPLNDVLMHFSFATTRFYENIREVLDDLVSVAESLHAGAEAGQ